MRKLVFLRSIVSIWQLNYGRIESELSIEKRINLFILIKYYQNNRYECILRRGEQCSPVHDRYQTITDRPYDDITDTSVMQFLHITYGQRLMEKEKRGITFEEENKLIKGDGRI
ncbi:hypothetical protein [Anaerosolibacter carboniphilus]|uniref:hypothetical protein n=1 Tax=Anaerosolibacter carboniphilus TaxID=1417629 RepID=UPI001A9B8F06|nr:hypothetical protein [Anaerosolibacter carboniphilus]